MVHADEIPWTLSPVPRSEYAGPADVALLSHTDLAAYATDLRDDLRAVRTLLHEALTLLHKQHQDLARATRIIAAFHDRQRATRERVS